MDVVAAVRRKVQERFPHMSIPDMPSEIAKEKAMRDRERQRLSQNVRWDSLFGRSYSLGLDADIAVAPDAVWDLDLERDRMFLVIAPGDSASEFQAVRRLIKVRARDVLSKSWRS
jgi:hypothetical protein